MLNCGIFEWVNLIGSAVIGYPPMAFYLNKTGRPIALSCEYALYQRVAGINVSLQGFLICLLRNCIMNAIAFECFKNNAVKSFGIKRSSSDFWAILVYSFAYIVLYATCNYIWISYIVIYYCFPVGKWCGVLRINLVAFGFLKLIFRLYTYWVLMLTTVTRLRK